MARISELHYSNAYARTSGVSEFLEVSLSPSENPADYTVAFYNADGTVGFTVSLNDPGVTVTYDATSNEYVYVISADNFPILLTDPDSGRADNYEAFALVDNTSGTVVDFYDIGGGTQNITAVDGPAAGATSTNISTPTGPSTTTTTIQFNKPDPTTPVYAPVSPGDSGVICFGRGALLDTPRGPVAVERLAAGDLVTTLDNGPQPLLWVGCSQVAALGKNAPVLFLPGALGNSRHLQVSPEHRMLVTGACAELYFGVDEVLVAAKHLVNGTTIRRCPAAWVDYFHVMFDRHELVTAEGAICESFFATGNSLSMCAPAARRELQRLMAVEDRRPDAFAHLVRPALRAREAALLAA